MNISRFPLPNDFLNSKDQPKNAIGIIAGSGPDAGIDLWQKILAAARSQLANGYKGDLSAPEVVVFSIPELGLSMELSEHYEVVRETLIATAEKISEHVSYYTIACNTLHCFAGCLKQSVSSAEFVSYSDCAYQFLKNHNISRVGLLAASPVLNHPRLAPYNWFKGDIEIEVPSNIPGCDNIIYDIKTRGAENPDLVQRFIAMANDLSAETILLACTELSALSLPNNTSKKFIDVTDLVAERLVNLSL